MSKALTILGMVSSVLILVLFALDLVLGFPFHRSSLLIDIVFLLCAAGLGYLSWTAFQDLD